MTENKLNRVARNSDNDEIDLFELLAALQAGKWRIALCSLIAVIAAFAYLWTYTPVYRADTLLQVQEHSAGILDELPSLTGEEAGATTEMEVLRSRSVVGEVVDQLSLDVFAEAKRFPVIGRAIARRYGGEGLVEAPADFLRQYAWGGERISLERFVVPENRLGAIFRLVALEAGDFELLDSVGEKLGRGSVNSRFSALSGDLQLFVSEIVAKPGTEFLISRMRHDAAVSSLQSRLSISEKGRKTGIISVSLEGTNPSEIQETLLALANGYVKQNVERVSAEAQKSLEFLDLQLPLLRGQLEASEAELTAYRQRSNAADLTLETKAILDKLVGIEAELRALQLRRDELLQRFASQHPSILILAEQEQSLRADIDRLKAEIDTLPQTQQDVLRLSRDTQVNAELYTFLLNKSQELRVVKAGTVGNVRVLDPPYEPYSPVKPRRRVILMAALMLGAFFGVAWIIIRKATRKAILSTSQVEDALGLPIFAVVPHSDAEKSAVPRKVRGKSVVRMPLLGVEDPKDPAYESIRSLRTSLHFALIEAENKRVVITGPSPSIGKSFLSTNLALALAEADNKVILVDADMRKGHINRYFGTSREPGLSDILSGRAELSEVLVELPENPLLRLIPTGVLPPNPSELLLTPRWNELLQQLESIADVVIIDTPPVMAVTDACIAAQGAAATFLITRYGVNTTAELCATISRLRNNNVDVSGVVFNGLEKQAGAGRYDQYSFYQYEYK